VNPGSLQASWRSKYDIYNYFSKKKQYLLPHYNETPLSNIHPTSANSSLTGFVKQLLKREKNALKLEDVRTFMVPLYAEVIFLANV